MAHKKISPACLLAPIVIIFSILACNFPSASQVATQSPSTTPLQFTLEDFPELAIYGELATIQPGSITAAVGPQAGRMGLYAGASLEIPAGAFPAENQLQQTWVDLAFDQISFDAKISPFFVLTPREEVPVLGVPLILEIPIPEGDVTVLLYDGQYWQQVTGPRGGTALVEITHFSNFIWAYLEWRAEEAMLAEQAENPSLNIPKTKMRTYIENGDANTRSFFGVDESAIQSPDKMCDDILKLLEQYNTPKNRAFPADSSSMSLGLVPFLFDGAAPEKSGGYYYDITIPALENIHATVLSSDPGKPLSPADVLKISIDANGGNIPLGVLSAHNYLKTVKYQGLADFKVGKPFPPEWGGAASHLASWREDDNITPAGEYDKMGPIYHIFAAMSAGLWMPTKFAGAVAVNGEAMLRTFRHGGDRPDLEKADADACGNLASDWLRDHTPSEQPPAAQPSAFIPFTLTDCEIPGRASGIKQEADDTRIYCWFTTQNGVNNFTLEYFQETAAAQAIYNADYAGMKADMASQMITVMDVPGHYFLLLFNHNNSELMPDNYVYNDLELYREHFYIFVNGQISAGSRSAAEAAAQDLLADAEAIADQHYQGK
jgi:hypothetical protein